MSVHLVVFPHELSFRCIDFQASLQGCVCELVNLFSYVRLSAGEQGDVICIIQIFQSWGECPSDATFSVCQGLCHKPVNGFNEQGGGEDASLFNSSVDSETVGYMSLTDNLTVEISLQGLDDVDYFGSDSIVVKYFPQG